MSKYSIRYLDRFGCAERTAFAVFTADEAARRHALDTIGPNASIEIWKHSLDPSQDQRLVLSAVRDRLSTAEGVVGEARL